MSKDASFVVRISKEELDKFNEILSKNAVNRAELIRIWIRKYIEENDK